MNAQKRWTLAAMAAGLFCVLFAWRWRGDREPSGHVAGEWPESAPVHPAAAGDHVAEAAGPADTQGILSGMSDADGRTDMPAAPSADAESGEVQMSPRERAMEAWERLVNDLGVSSTDNQSAQVTAAFAKLAEADRLDGIRQALNLVSDESFGALCGILYDKQQDPEILDTIFGDALNRPDEVKTPILEHLRKDRQHPMFAEAARILDLTQPAAEP